MELRKIKIRLLTLICLPVLPVIMGSCYSVRIAVKDAAPEPAGPVIVDEGYWRDKKVHIIDTTVNIGVLDNEAMYLARCPEGFHTVEYRVTLGQVLLSGITLGKVRKVRIKYACVKQDND